MELEDRTVLVTGASRNIGRAIAVKMAEEGADVGITARMNRDGCAETARLVREAGGDASISLADLGEPSQIEAMVGDIRNELGSIDVLVNNATYRPVKPFLDVTLEDIDRVTDVNFRGLFLTTQHVVPDMLDEGGGSIVNLIGAMVYLGRPEHVHSYGTKFAIEGQTRQLATELGGDGIRVNAVSPGLIDVGREQTEEWERLKQSILESTPLGRMGSVEEIAEICSFLASERASFITGQVIHANGGTYPIPNVVPNES
jgi:3-oxoacyl-[acyl-carrier protein] reductase